MYNLFKLSLILLIGLIYTSCGNEVDCSRSAAAQLQSESSGLQTALIVYQNNPTIQTCEAYGRALDKYIKAVKPFRDCTQNAADLASFDQAIVEIEKARTELECM
jgi:hypothetical protein